MKSKVGSLKRLIKLTSLRLTKKTKDKTQINKNKNDKRGITSNFIRKSSGLRNEACISPLLPWASQA